MNTPLDHDGYEISTDPARLDIPLVHRWLSTDAYWAMGRTLDAMERAVRHSINFGAYDSAGTQVGFARVVTDQATFAWLCDVYVDRGARGRGLGGRLVEAVVAYLAPFSVRRVLLATADAHGVYATYGFAPLSNPERWMALYP